MTNTNTAPVAPAAPNRLLVLAAQRAGMTFEAYMAAKAARIEAQQAENARAVAAERAVRLAARAAVETELMFATDGAGWFSVTSRQLSDAWNAGHADLKAVYERRADGRVVRSYWSAKR